ncbi:MAG: oxidoreductase C-terminal domain-containing protein, partial [Phycisphaerae bacterium]
RTSRPGGPTSGEPMRIEHWRLAEQHGRCAAHNMAGKKVEFTGVPFFWTEQFGTIIQYVGHAREWDEIVFDGGPASKQFVAFYVKGDRVLAAAGRNSNRQMGAAAELMRTRRMPTPRELAAGSVDLLERLNGG